MKLIESLFGHLHERYVFPEVATRIEEQLRPRMAEYSAISSGEELSRRLTADLQEIGRDKHLGIYYSEKRLPPESDQPTAEQLREWEVGIALDNGGFHKVERLPGNVGYLELTRMAPAEVAGNTAAAAMSFLATTEALIIDLRSNGGGQPTMVAMLCSYFLPARTHLNSVHLRQDGRINQFWTLPYVPGRQYLEKPLYILTSNRTFSAAEEFCYDLQSLKRATIVGETTGGGAHPIAIIRLDDHFEAAIPRGRPVNPITGTNWEGTGVTPDIAVPAEEAWKTAYADALRHVIARAERESLPPWEKLRYEAQRALADLKA